jgi:hypothetical protein
MTGNALSAHQHRDGVPAYRDPSRRARRSVRCMVLASVRQPGGGCRVGAHDLGEALLVGVALALGVGGGGGAGGATIGSGARLTTGPGIATEGGAAATGLTSCSVPKPTVAAVRTPSASKQ